MSKMRFALAKKYIHERHYQKAREILDGMPDNPTAQKWLTQLDELDPPIDVRPAPLTGHSPEKAKRMPSSQARKYALDKEAHKAQIVRRIAGSILSVIGVGIMAFMLVAKPFLQRIEVPYASGNQFVMTYGSMYFDAPLEAHCVTGLILGIGLALLYAGLHLFWHPGREPDHY